MNDQERQKFMEDYNRNMQAMSYEQMNAKQLRDYAKMQNAANSYVPGLQDSIRNMWPELQKDAQGVEIPPKLTRWGRIKRCLTRS